MITLSHHLEYLLAAFAQGEAAGGMVLDGAACRDVAAGLRIMLASASVLERHARAGLSAGERPAPRRRTHADQTAIVGDNVVTYLPWFERVQPGVMQP